MSQNRYTADFSGPNSGVQVGQNLGVIQNVSSQSRQVTYVGDAAFDSHENRRHRRCLPGTRVDILAELTEWAYSKSPKYILWLSGRAGSGKSTIALTIAQTIDGDDDNAVLASFFFKRGHSELSSARRLIGTIAHQFASASSAFREALQVAIEENPDIDEFGSIPTQFNNFLLLPLRQAYAQTGGGSQYIVVLDALDECEKTDDIQLFLSLLNGAPNLADHNLRVFITSRPEAPIHRQFSQMDHILYYRLDLNSVSSSTVDRDISRFINSEFTRIWAEHPFLAPWSDQQLQTITEAADGLFIYAAIVCRYVGSFQLIPPTQRLQQLCKGDSNSKSMKALDDMYLIILDNATKRDFELEELNAYVRCLRQVIGGFLFLLQNLSIMELTQLLSLPSAYTTRICLESINAVFQLPDNDSTHIPQPHQSFRDFLTNADRCRDLRFLVDEESMHRELFRFCLALMKKSLRPNCCQLPPGVRLREISQTKLDVNIPEELRYACSYWVEHFSRANADSSDYDLIYEFLTSCVLQWFEVLILIGKFSDSIEALIKLEGLLLPIELKDFVHDMERFARSFSQTLLVAPLQIYASALTFAPENSLVRRHFSSLIESTVSVQTDLSKQWNPCIQTLEGHSYQQWDPRIETLEGHFSEIVQMCFSSDGKYLASGDESGTILIWNPHTGQWIYTIKTDQETITKISISPDSTIISSAHHFGAVGIWDLHTGQNRGILQNECPETSRNQGFHYICGMHFTPDGLILVFWCCCGSIGIWNLLKNQYEHLLYFSRKSTCTFSPDGSCIAIGYLEGLIQILDLDTGRLRSTPFQAHKKKIFGLEFSEDMAYLISGSFDGTVRVWELSTGICQHTLSGFSDWNDSNKVTIMFSLDHSSILVATEFATCEIRAWRTGESPYISKTHPVKIHSLCMSPKNVTLAASVKNGTEIAIWDMLSGQVLHSLTSNSARINCIRFSPDGAYMSSTSWTSWSGNSEKRVIIRLWDMTLDTEPQTEGPKYEIKSMALSNDGHYLAANASGLVHVRDVRLKKHVATLAKDITEIYCILFSPKEYILACHSARTIDFWDVITRSRRATVTLETQDESKIAFSSDGQSLASASGSNVHIWDTNTGNCRQTFHDDLSWASTLSFSRSGSYLACSGSRSGRTRSRLEYQVQLWDINRHKCLLFSNFLLPIFYLAFSPDENSLACFEALNIPIRMIDIQGRLSRKHGLDTAEAGLFSPVGSEKGVADPEINVSTRVNGKWLHGYLPVESGEALKFSDDGMNLVWKGVTVAFHQQSSSHYTSEIEYPHLCLDSSTGNYEFKDWVTLNGRRVLWIPPEYRAACSARLSNMLILGRNTGRITFISRDVHA